jgi:hypothetical protein
VTEFENLMRIFLGVHFVMCLGFHCPIYSSVQCDNGVTFQVVSYILFLGFLSGLTELVRVTGLLMLQRCKYDQFLVTCLLSANVAQTEIWSELCNILIVCICCKVSQIIMVMVIIVFYEFVWCYLLLNILLLLRYKLFLGNA